MQIEQDAKNADKEATKGSKRIKQSLAWREMRYVTVTQVKIYIRKAAAS